MPGTAPISKPFPPFSPVSVAVPVEEYRLPKEQTKRTALVETIGADGYALLDAIDTTPDLNWLQHVPAVEILRRVWVQLFELIEGKPHFRANDNIPPPPKMLCSPYDIS